MATFQLPVHYWPTRSALFWWENFSFSEVRRDLQTAAAHGFRQWAVALMWNDFGPGAGRVSLSAMRSLETLLQAVEDAGIGVRLTLFPVYAGRTLWLPDFLALPVEGSNYPVLSGHHRHRRQIRNLFADPIALASEVKLTREVIGAFDQHPAVEGWVLGDRLTAASTLARAGDFERWWHDITAAVREAGGRKPLWHGVGVADIIRNAAIDAEVLREYEIGLVVRGDWRPGWAWEDRQVWASFVTAYALALTARPPLLADLVDIKGRQVGQSTPQGTQIASALQNVVRAVHESGGGGYEAAALFDFADEVKRAPPFDVEPDSLHSGLLTADGVLTSAGFVWRDLTASRLDVTDARSRVPEVDLEARSRAPEDVARELYDVWGAQW